MLACSMKEDMFVDPQFISTPQIVEFPTEDSASTNVKTAHGYYYPPRNGKFAAPDGEAPPLLVKVSEGR